MYQIHLVCQRQCTVSQFSIVEGDEVSQADVLRMYRRTMSATMDGRAIKAPRFSAPTVRCSTSRSSHATGGTTSTAQRHRRTLGIHTFPSSVNYGLLFLFHFVHILYSSFLSLLVFIFLSFPFSYFLFTSFSLSIAFTSFFAFNIYYYYYYHHHHHHYHCPLLYFVSLSNPFILPFLLFLPPFCLFCSSYSVCSFSLYSISPSFFYFLSFTIFLFFRVKCKSVLVFH